jgi:hypothetical protein
MVARFSAVGIGCAAAQIGLLRPEKALPKGRVAVIIWVRLGCPVRRQIFVTSSFPTFLRGPLQNQAHRELVNRALQFHKRRQLLIRTNDETFSVAMHAYEVRPRKDHRGVDLISDVLPFGRLWYDTPDNAIGTAAPTLL